MTREAAVTKYPKKLLNIRNIFPDVYYLYLGARGKREIYGEKGGNASLIKCPPFHAKGIFSLFHPLGFYSNFSGWKLALRIGKNVKNIESIMQ